MSLVDKINTDIKVAMLAKEKLEALRAIKSALLLAQTDKTSGGEVTEDAEIKLLQKLIKQRCDAAEIYKSQGRQDLYDIETSQIKIIEQYLPEQLSETEIKQIVTKIITETGAAGIKDMGRVMGAAAKELAGKADNKTIAGIVKQLLDK